MTWRLFFTLGSRSLYNFSFFVWGLFFSWEEATISWVDVKGELDDPPLVKRSRKLHLQLKVGKSPGINSIPAKVYQHGGEAVFDKLQELFANCWEKRILPQDTRDAVIVSLYKSKGEQSDCSNY